MPNMTRTPNVNKSNTAAGAPGNILPNPNEPVQYYEQSYITTGAQEWIYLPDAGSVSITLSGSGSWVATVEATDSPPDVVLAGNAVTVAWINGTQTATTSSALLTGATAVRANVTTVGTSVKISVRC